VQKIGSALSKQFSPNRQLLFEAHRHVRRRTRWQHHSPVAGAGELQGEFTGGLAIEADRFQHGTERVQALEIVGGRLADRGIEAAFALAGAEYVPQADAVRTQARQALYIWQRRQVFADKA
jgi:hypothetical protein